MSMQSHVNCSYAAMLCVSAFVAQGREGLERYFSDRFERAFFKYLSGKGSGMSGTKLYRTMIPRLLDECLVPRLTDRSN